MAPDMRGYNLSSRPDGVSAYDIGRLTDDIAGLIRECGAGSALLAVAERSPRPVWNDRLYINR